MFDVQSVHCFGQSDHQETVPFWCSFTPTSPIQPNRETGFSSDFPSPDEGDDLEGFLDKGHLSAIFSSNK
jgi:hypothetical protein